LGHAEIIFGAFDKDNSPGLNVTELKQALRVVSVNLGYNDAEVVHVKFDTDEDEVISREEFVAVSSFERTSGQRAWRFVAHRLVCHLARPSHRVPARHRMMVSYGWFFWFLLFVTQVLVLSYVEGRHFNSLGAFLKYKELTDGTVNPNPTAL